MREKTLDNLKNLEIPGPDLQILVGRRKPILYTKIGIGGVY